MSRRTSRLVLDACGVVFFVTLVCVACMQHAEGYIEWGAKVLLALLFVTGAALHAGDAIDVLLDRRR